MQLLWVNLIMDTFAALALATDPPSRSVLDRKPDRKSASLITLRMAKMIIGQAICQLAITFCLNFGGTTLLGYGTSEHEVKRLKTLVFNTFVWLQIFNEVNNRRLDNKINIFEGITRNWFFIGINLIMIGGQVLIIFVGGEAFEIVPLNGKEWGLSVGLGAISLPWGVLIRMFRDEWVAACLPWFIRKRWAPESITPSKMEAHRRNTFELEEGIRPPLRTLSTLRGDRARQHIRGGSGFRAYMHEQKVKAKKAIKKTAAPAHAVGPVKTVESASEQGKS